MSIESAESSISYNRMQIVQHLERIQKLRNDIDKLMSLEEEYRKLKRRFQEHNEESVSVIENIILIGNPLKAVNSYGEGMKNFLTGSQYHQVLEEFDDARRVVTGKVIELENEIRTLESAVGSCEEQIRRSQAEILQIKAREAKENGI